MVMVMVIGGDDDDDGDIAEQRWDVLTTRGAMSRLYHQQSWSRVVDRETMTMTMNIDILPRCPASAGCSEVSSTICSPIHRTAQGQSQPIPISKYMCQYQYQYKISRYTIIISIKTANMNIYTWPLYRFSLATCFCAIGSSSSRHLPTTISHG